jgi:hypothetical protein
LLFPVRAAGGFPYAAVNFIFIYFTIIYLAAVCRAAVELHPVLTFGCGQLSIVHQ